MNGLITTFQQTVIEGGPSVSLPLWQILLFLAIVSVAAITGKHKAIALICYGFLAHLLMQQNLPVYTMNSSAVITLALTALVAVLGLVATCYQMLRNCA
ncbi:MAG: hypothetical protein R6V56_05620 [Lentisphaeria bacterium]